MDILQKAFDKEVEELVESAKTEADYETLADIVHIKLRELINQLPMSMLDSIKRLASEGGLEERRELHSAFVQRNLKKWNKGFEIIEIFVEICSEAGECVNNRMRSAAAENKDITFDILVRLHAKACLVAREIVCLLKNGFADAAHARWRALHELTVTALFLEKNDDETTERYCLHEVVEAYKGACLHKKFGKRLQATPPSDEDIAYLKTKYDQVIERFGSDFQKPYGWAYVAIGKKQVSFLDIEEAVSLDHWRPYYKWASQSIHANVKTIRHSLGLSETKEDMLLVGPSDSGMVDPAHSMAISLAQITVVLAGRSPNLDELVMMQVISTLSQEVGNTFFEEAKTTQSQSRN